MIKLTNNKEQQEEVPVKLTETEHPKTEFLAFPLKVIISPFKAFKAIAQNPDFKGIVLIAGLVLLATAGLYSAYSSKLFFLVNGTETSLLASNMFSNYILSALTQTGLLFFFNWLIYAGILLLVMRAFGQKGGSWRPFLVVVGYAFSVTIIQWVVGALLVSTLPEVHLQITSWPPTQQDETIVTSKFSEMWGSNIAFQAFNYLTFPYINIIDVWLVMLSVIIVHTFGEITWGKAAAISTTAFIIRVFVKIFLGA